MVSGLRSDLSMSAVDSYSQLLECEVIEMARVIVHESQGPMEIRVGGESKWLCKCGLSKNDPYCDGSHKKTQDEEEGKVYRYNNDETREEV